MQKLTCIICLFILVSCQSTKPVADFCDLPNYKGQKVYIKANYCGVEEYWSLSGKKSCNEKLNVDLQFKSGNTPFVYKSIFNKVHNRYYNSCLEIEAIGVFENDSKSGYGHLGSNNSVFLVSNLISAKLIKKRVD